MASKYDAKKAAKLRDNGIKTVKEKHLDWVMQARGHAIRIAKRKGRVTSDDVQRVYPRPKSVHPNCVGAIFHTPCLIPTGFVQSCRVSAHQRWIREFKYAY